MHPDAVFIIIAFAALILAGAVIFYGLRRYSRRQ